MTQTTHNINDYTLKQLINQSDLSIDKIYINMICMYGEKQIHALN